MSEQSVTLLDRGFSLLIAFLLPGLIALFGVATVDTTVRAWFSGAQTGPTFVGLLFVLLAALALNLVITAVRWFLFEYISWPFVGSIIPVSPSFDQKKRKGLEVQYIDLRHQFYYHYLAYANAAVALLLGAAAWWFLAAETPALNTTLAVFGVALVTSVILTLAARDAIDRYDKRTESLIGLGSTATS